MTLTSLDQFKLVAVEDDGYGLIQPVSGGVGYWYYANGSWCFYGGHSKRGYVPIRTTDTASGECGYGY